MRDFDTWALVFGSLRLQTESFYVKIHRYVALVKEAHIMFLRLIKLGNVRDFDFGLSQEIRGQLVLLEACELDFISHIHVLNYEFLIPYRLLTGLILYRCFELTALIFNDDIGVHL